MCPISGYRSTKSKLVEADFVTIRNDLLHMFDGRYVGENITHNLVCRVERDIQTIMEYNKQEGKLKFWAGYGFTKNSSALEWYIFPIGYNQTDFNQMLTIKLNV